MAKDFIWSFPEHYAAGRCRTFCGNVGTGKTSLACAMAQTLVNIGFLLRGNRDPHDGWFVDNFYSARYTTASEIVRKIRDTWGTGAKTSTTEVIEKFARVDLLVIDEIGAQAGTDNERSLLYEVIDERYQAMRSTIAISNCDRKGLTTVLGERTLDRLRDRGGLVCVFDWESFRK
jgi:DNA replication protein DnaC